MGDTQKTRAKIACLHDRIACIRQDAIYKTTSDILAITKPAWERPFAVVIENLNVTGIMRNGRLARAIGDVGMGEFVRQVAYKCDWYGSEMVLADRWFPSSKTCSRCGYVKDMLTLGERTYIFERCGYTIDCDLNATINLEH